MHVHREVYTPAGNAAGYVSQNLEDYPYRFDDYDRDDIQAFQAAEAS